MKHRHHKIPKHAGGTNDPSNIEHLTLEEHAAAHEELWKTHGKIEDYCAWKGLTGLLTKKEIYQAMVRQPKSSWFTSAPDARRTPTPERIAKMAASLRGRKLSDEHKARLSEKLKGRKKKPRTKEHCLAISRGKMGKKIKPCSDNRRAKISNALMGRTLTPEHAAKIAMALRGRKLSDEHKAALSAARRRNVRS